MAIARTNYGTNPRAVGSTGFATTSVVPSEVGTTTYLTGQVDGPAGGPDSYGRRSVTTQGVGGSGGWTAIGGSNRAPLVGVVGDMVPVSVWVRYTGPGTLTITMRAAAYTSGGSFAGQTDSDAVALASGVWVRLSSTVTATLGYASIGWWAYFQGTSSPMPAGSTLDATGALVGTTGPYFDGSTAAHDNKAYAWTGTANASASTESNVLPTTTLQPLTDAPCPRIGVTIDGLGAGTTTYNLWRTSDGVRKRVRGSRNRTTVESDYIIDYEAPLGRPVTYEVEVVSGTNVLATTYPGTATLTSGTWWIQDPLVPSSAIPLAVNHQNTGIPNLTAAAVKSLEYAADVTIIPILGSPEPVALMGGGRIAGNVDFSMFTRAAEATTTLRNLIKQTPLLLVRTNGVRNDGIPGLAYFASAHPIEQPVTVAFGGTLTEWKLQGDLVAAPSLNILVPIWTYGDVQALWSTYQQAQTALAAKKYLDVLKSPTGV